MQIIAAAASLLVLAATVVGQPFINTVGLNECQPSLLTFGGGQPPYIISAFPPGQTTGDPLEVIASGVSGTSLSWTVNLPAEQTITLGIKDSTGAAQASGQITIATGGTGCLNSTSVVVSAGPTSAGAGTTTIPAGASSVTGATTSPISAGTSAAASGTSKAASGTSASSASSPTPSKSSALTLSAGPAAIIGMVLGAFFA